MTGEKGKDIRVEKKGYPKMGEIRNAEEMTRQMEILTLA
mgnify:CR=1 FL=1